MQDSIHPKRLARLPRARVLAATALVSGILVAGCGGGSGSPPVARLPSATKSGSSTAAGGGAASSSSTPPSRAQLLQDELKFAKCMRANGVPDFPDPTSAGGVVRFDFPAGAGGPTEASQAKCNKLLPGGGALAPGTSTHPSTQLLAHWLKVSQCMRKHGVLDFPDPSSSIPSNLAAAGVGTVSDRDGVILVFPRTIDQQSPQFAHAAAACEFRLTNH